MTERQREVGLALCHRRQQSFHHVPIAGVASFETDLRSETFLQRALVKAGEQVESGFGLGH